MRFLNGRLIYWVNGRRHRIQFDPYQNYAKQGLLIKVDCSDISPPLSGLHYRLTVANTITIEDLTLYGELEFQPTDRIFTNGYQSWTTSEEHTISKKIKGMRLIFTPWIKHYKLNKYGDYDFYRQLGRLHSYTYTYIKRENRSIQLIGSLTERQGFTVFDLHPKKQQVLIIKDSRGVRIDGGTTLLNILILTGDENQVFDAYFDARRTVNSPHTPFSRSVLPDPQTGWTSWYYHFQNIDENIVIQNLNAFAHKQVPIDIFQIDDGWQEAVGDWLKANHKFPNGMKWLANRIRQQGYKPGLWLAPFIAEQKSQLVKEHSQWLLCDRNNRPVVAGYNPFNWSGYFYALNLDHPEVRDYLRQVFDTILKDWAFDLVKLDFLYAVALIHRPNKSRGQVMIEAMEFMRELAGNKWILGCGVPLEAAFDRVEFCRIGSDVGLSWEDQRMKKIGFRERASTINSITSTIGRRHLNGKVFQSDPDVFILRDRQQWFTDGQRETLFLVNQIFGGLVFTSDNIEEYTQSQLSLYLSQFPLRFKRIEEVTQTGDVWEIRFSIGALNYIAFVSLGKAEYRTILSEGWFYNASDGWKAGGSEIVIKGFHSKCFLRLGEDQVVIAGSEGHIFPGSEVMEFGWDGQSVTLKLMRKAIPAGNIYLRIPNEWSGVNVNHKYIQSRRIGSLNLVSVDKAKI